MRVLKQLIGWVIMIVFKTGACQLQASMHWFFENALDCVSVCTYVRVCVLCVCSPLRALITSGAILTMCDWLNKFMAFPLFSSFILHLLLIKLILVALVNSTSWIPAKKTKVRNAVLKEHPTVATRWGASIMKVSGWIHSDTFKRRLAFSFTVMISA